MNRIMIADVASASNYCDNVSLPAAPDIFVTRGSSPSLPQPEFSAGGAQAIAVGSQIAEFSPDISSELRAAISNSFLLAQLAANRHMEDSPGQKNAWYERYLEVLANVGWIVETEQESRRQIDGDSAEVHQAIIPVLTSILGTAAAATTVIAKILEGLSQMDQDAPWITLFDRSSQRASANQFQLSRAVIDLDGRPRISVGCFELDASRSITQVLFFKVSSSGATLNHFGARLSINEAVFNSVSDVVENRVQDYVSSYVADIPI
jgi:hypothetical protein